MAVYDRIGATYGRTRRPDPRIDAAVRRALGGARSVVNVGAGAGSYEPPETVLAVEPSAVMISQRRAGLAPVVQTTAEAIPLAEGEVDAALAVLTIHHWPDLERGFAEMRRVARRIVVLTWDPGMAWSFWLSAEYLPREAVEWDVARCPTLATVAGLVGGEAEVTPVPVPHDCTDGFFGAFWRRPESYLDPVVRAGISNLAHFGAELDPAFDRLAADLESGAWQRRHADLLDLSELDIGYRIVAGPA
jgi:SAM-dependent methyltransferase